MAIKWSALATQFNADAAGIAAAVGGGATAAEMSGLADIFSVLALRNDLAQVPVSLADTKEILPG